MLEELGTRICILGPSNSGKSTLTDAIGKSCGLAVVHLDLLFHRPGTDWERRPEAEFLALHDHAIAGERWVVDRNYTRCLPGRLERATGVIWLDVSTATSLLRYVRRTLFEKRTRVGGLTGGLDSLKWSMVHHIAVTTRANRKRYADLFDMIVLPKVALLSVQAITAFYAAERLEPHGRRALMSGRG